MRYDAIPSDLFKLNRTAFAKQMKKNSMAVFVSNEPVTRSADAAYKWRQNPDTFYLSGIDQEETYLILYPDAPEPKYREVLFVRRTSEQIKIWEGKKHTQEEARAISGVQQVLWSENFENTLCLLMHYAEQVYLNTNEHDRSLGMAEATEIKFARKIQAQFPLHKYERAAPLLHALRSTLLVTFAALLISVVLGVLAAFVLVQSRLIERSLMPYVIIMQVTPIVAIAPLIIIWANDIDLSLLICAWIVAFFPILSNTILGLNSADHNLVNLFELYGASRWQTMRYLKLPAALPYFFSGLRIAGGLALIGAIVAELAAGAAGQGTGLAFRITEAGFRLNIPRMFAALTLISLTGIAIYALFTALSNLALGRWHDSARVRDR